MRRKSGPPGKRNKKKVQQSFKEKVSMQPKFLCSDKEEKIIFKSEKKTKTPP